MSAVLDGAESVLDRTDRLPREAVPSVARLACASLALVAGGKVKSERARMHVVAVIGDGVVEGLEVSTGDGVRLAIPTGSAVKGDGSEIAPERDRAVKRRKDP